MVLPWRFCLLLVVACMAHLGKAMQHRDRQNPIRKVVNLLMAMQKKVELEGKQTKELYDKFMCNAKTVRAALEESIKAAEEHIPQLESSIKEVSAEHQQLAEDLNIAKEEREKAEEAMSKANSMREKEAAEFAKDSTNQKADIKAVVKAVKALEKGAAGGAFLQSSPASVLRRLAMSSNVDLSNVDRDLLSSFLQGSGQAPSSGEILGILKQMNDEMNKDLAEMVASEDTAVADHSALVTAKKKEIKASTKAIEIKTGRKGKLAVELTNLNYDVEDHKESLEKDSKLLGENKHSVEVKEHEYDGYNKVQGEELVTLADTIKLLNDDDALDTFKKTLPSPSASSFVQMLVTPKQMKRDALHVLRSARKHSHKRGHPDPRLDLLSLWVQGRKGGNFNEVLTKIDKLISNLKKEQDDDTAKKEWCLAEVAKTEDEVKWTARSVSDVKKVIASSKEDFKAILAEIDAVTKGIKELDHQVQDATKQRQAESAMHNKLLAENGAAKELLTMAKNRLNTFYNPELVKAPERKEPEAALLQQDRVNDADLVDKNDSDDSDSSDQAPSFVQVREHSQEEDEQSLDDSAEAEEQDEAAGTTDVSATIKHKKQKSAGAIELLNLLMADVTKQIQEIEHEEQEGQKDYEIFLKDSSAKRSVDSKALADKESSKAKVESEIQKAMEKQEGEESSLDESKKELYELHNDCDWLLKNYDARKNAREDESDALTKARAVLSGANYE